MTLEEFSERWVTPSTLMIVVGAIVWGIQLNAAVMDLTKEISRIEERVTTNTEINIAQNEALARIGVLLDTLEKRVSKTEGHAIEHEREAEQWKRRIQANEARSGGGR